MCISGKIAIDCRNNIKIVTCRVCKKQYTRKLWNEYLCPCVECDPPCPRCGVKDGSENQE